MPRYWKPALAILTISALALIAFAAPPATGPAPDQSPLEQLQSPLAGISQARTGKPMHVGSTDPTGRNNDCKRVAPGQTITLLNYDGPGIVRRFWVTIAPRSEFHIHCQAILRMYWDGDENPAVEVPIGEFFGVGFGEQHDYVSAPLDETSGGYNCYWPMPFHKSARWTLTNLSDQRIDNFYYNIDFTAYDSVPDSQLHFHAQWRRENPTKPGVNYTILDTTGRGQFVGAALFMQGMVRRDFSFLEGNEMIYLDGEKTPSIQGTGTEDYFSSGWYFDQGTYSSPYHGLIIKDELNSRISAYRWHIEDAMPYTSSIRVTIQHGDRNREEADYSSVAYFYQAGPALPPPGLPKDPNDLLPMGDAPAKGNSR